MTAPTSRPAPRYAREPDPYREVEPTVARRQDVRRLAESGPPDAELPPVHGGKGDPRYPAPITGLRVIRDDDGTPPTLGPLVKQWFVGLFTAVSMPNW